jgi:hypothetical protein
MMMAKLDAAMRKIAECGEMVYGEKRWNSRWGFMYCQFTAAQSQRTD